MSDPKDEPARRADVDAPDLRHAEHLAARATDSLGLIDVRHTERKYTGMLNWLAARTSLVEHLRSRYGLTDSDIRIGTLLLAGPEGTEEPAGFSAVPGFAEEHAETRLFTAVAHIPADVPETPVETRHVRRRGAPTFSPSGPDTGASAPPKTEGKTALELSGPSTDQPQPSQFPLPLKTMPDNSVATPPATHGRTASTTDTESNDLSKRADKPPARASELTAGTGGPAPSTRTGAREAKGVREASNRDILRVDEASETKLSSHETPTYARRQWAEPTSTGDAPPDGDAVPERPLARGTKARGVKAEAVPRPVAHELRAPVVSEEEPLALPRARELPAGGFEHAQSVRPAQSRLPLASSPHNAASTPTPPVLTTGAAPFVRPAATGGIEPQRAQGARGKPPEVNVERLAEQVSRHLARRLLVERERRGLGKR